MPAGFRSLGHDHVRPDLERELDVRAALDLAQQRHAGLAHAGRERTRVAERQHDRPRLAVEHVVEQPRLARERPGDKPATAVGRSGLVELRIDPSPVAVPAADEPEPAGVRDRRRQAPARREGHRRQHHRMHEPQTLRQPVDSGIAPII